MKFTPGPGVGGHCLPVDPSYLSWRVRQTLGKQFRFVELANDVNEHMPDYVVWRLMMLLNRSGRALNGAKVLVLGLSYKKNSGDARESPAVRVIELLRNHGAEVRAADPFMSEPPPALVGVPLVDVSDAEVVDADVVVLLTDHDAFDLKQIASRAAAVLDTRNRFEPARNVERL
jgi:UDP-N-acetyl-D-glucosamine dehydrogenase